MRRALAFAALAATLLVPPAAFAAPPTNAQLQAEINVLKAKATKQDKTIKTLQTQVTNAQLAASVALVFGVCGLAISADAFQGVFGVVDQISLNTPNVAKTFFGPQTPVSDEGACDLLKVVRTQVVPPTTAAFSALFSLLRSTSSSAAFDLLRGIRT